MMQAGRMSQARAEELLSRLEAFGTRLGLETTRQLLGGLGQPQERFFSVLVAGSNGKGSTSAILASILSMAGYRCGLFTSPHLEAVSERLQIDGRAVGDDRLAGLLESLVHDCGRFSDRPPTYFEALFVAACQWFAEEGVEIGILEVGLGGRLDATNACEPILSVITEIGLEHQAHLGESIQQIAREKAGILRPDRSAIVGTRDPEAVAAIREEGAAKDAPVRLVEEEVTLLAAGGEGWGGQRIRLRTPRREYALTLPLAGHHQRHNLASAVLAAEELAEQGWARIDRRAIEEGTASCRWPGRLERWIVPGGRLVILDAAHNRQAAEALARFLQQHLPRYTLLFGVLEDKDAEGMLACLSAGATRIVLTKPTGKRGRSPDSLRGLLPHRDGVSVVEAPRAALESALTGQEAVLVCGSIYLVGETRSLLRRLGADLLSERHKTGRDFTSRAERSYTNRESGAEPPS
jgi:dihydrofolate synthase/folylpolyglutamate synthase